MTTPLRAKSTTGKSCRALILGLATAFLGSIEVHSQEDAEEANDIKEPARFYRSPEERREAGLGTPLTEWLTFYGLLETEYEYSRDGFRDGSSISEHKDTEALQLGLEAEFTEWLLGELVLDVEYGKKLNTIVDEGVLAIEFDPWAFKGGMQNLDFGEFYSHFVTGPVLEYGETRRWSFSIERELNQFTDIVAYTFETENALPGGDLGWGISMEWVSEDESIRVGSGYISDLRESDDFFGEEDYASATRVAGWNFYALAGFESFEITAETVIATDYFKVEEAVFRPQSYNLEFAYFINYDFQFATRVEYNKQVMEEPDWQYGLAITWQIGNHLILSIDYLEGRFRKPPVIEEDEDYLRDRSIIAAQLGFEF